MALRDAQSSMQSGILDLRLLEKSFVLDDVELDEREVIGRGSFATVYRARWKGVQIAVKKLHALFFDDGIPSKDLDGLLARFYKELSINVALRHPNIIQFLGIIYSRESGCSVPRPMLAMELMDSTLEDRLGKLRGENARMPFRSVVDIASDVAAGLTYLHEQDLKSRSIAHRDLAPKNVLLSAEGRAKLCDLGVAKVLSGSPSQLQTPGPPGTPSYMPPEVFTGCRNYHAPAVDIYSFGVILLEMCSGVESNPSGPVLRQRGASGSYELVPEKERRLPSFEALGENGVLEELICLCLKSLDSERPRARDVLMFLTGVKSGELYSSSLVTGFKCKSCEESRAVVMRLEEHLQDSQAEVQELQQCLQQSKYEEHRLVALQEQLDMVARDAQKHQERILLLQEHLQKEVETKKSLQVTAERAASQNTLLQQKIEMDRNPDRFTNPPSKPWPFHSISLRYSGERSTLKPKKGIKSQVEISEPFLAQATKQSDCDRGASLSPDRNLSNPDTPDTEENNYVDAREFQSSVTSHDQPFSAIREPVYTEVLPSGPPLPPPRLKMGLGHGSWSHAPRRHINNTTKASGTSRESNPLAGTQNAYQKSQSMRASRGSSSQQPKLQRQGSREDVLIYRVTTSSKSRNLSGRDLQVTKGELVKVTNTAMDPKWCIAVSTDGRSGSVKKKMLELVKPVSLFYDVENPHKCRQRGLFAQLATCNKQNVWISPVISGKITITPSSLHSGDVNMLLKMTECLLCVTDGEQYSSFEIDLHKQRIAKLRGYLLQCHHGGQYNGYPCHWKLEGSYNGQTWTVLSEENGDYFAESRTCYFNITEPSPCRYFRLTQLSENSQGNHRLCLSGIEMFGLLYSSIGEEVS